VEDPDIVVTEMQSEADALHLLSMASPTKERRIRSLPAAGKRVDLAQCAFIKKGLITEDQLITLVDIFFKYHHHYYVSSKSPWRETSGLFKAESVCSSPWCHRKTFLVLANRSPSLRIGNTTS
jgi:hypothetical protein